MITSMIWQSDVDLVINRLAADKHNLKGRDYFYQTVGQIEAMKTPDGTRRLTLDELEAWGGRCREGEQADGRTDATDLDREDSPEDRLLQDTRKTINPKPLGTLHQHGE